MDEHVLPPIQRSEEVFVSGRGAWLVDQSGREYLDFLAGIAVNALGHAHEGLMDALRDQVGRLVHTSNLLRHPYTEPVAERLTRLAGMQAAFFCNSGSEANETAIKISRKVQRLRDKPHRTSFVALAGSFHGRTIGAVSLTSKEAYRAPFGPLLDVTFVEPRTKRGSPRRSRTSLRRSSSSRSRAKAACASSPRATSRERASCARRRARSSCTTKCSAEQVAPGVSSPATTRECVPTS
jgi:4-aminobutyrate aminotransferase-like enzyme